MALKSKIERFLSSPIKYSISVLYRESLYPLINKDIEVKASTFFDLDMVLLLPASIDIYLLGGKSDDSEIRLSKYLIQILNSDDIFFDIGAHFGYFSLLAHALLNDQGKIYAFEPASSSFDILKKNCVDKNNITITKKLVSNTSSPKEFIEFPNQYGEYNTSYIDQFKSELWFSEKHIKRELGEATTLDDFIRTNGIVPNFIKIDTEGSEHDIIYGASNTLSSNECTISMEFVHCSRDNKAHKKAHELLLDLGYNAHIILSDGSLQSIMDIEEYLNFNNMISDNIIYRNHIE